MPSSRDWVSIIKNHEYPPEAEKDRYEPCGNSCSLYPPPSPNLLAYYYENHPTERVTSQAVKRIPKKLHHKIYPNHQGEIVGWGLSIEEKLIPLAWAVLACYIITFLSGLVTIFYSAEQIFLDVETLRSQTTYTWAFEAVYIISSTLDFAGLFFAITTIYWLHDSYKAYNLCKRRTRSYRAKIPDDLRAQISRSISSTIDQGEDTTKESDPDLEGQRQETSSEQNEGRKDRWLKWSLGLFSFWRKRSPDDEDPKEPPMGDEEERPEGQEEYILVCVYNKPDLSPRLIQIPAKRCPNDYLFFKALRDIGSDRPWFSWNGFMTRCGLRGVIGIHYVKVLKVCSMVLELQELTFAFPSSNSFQMAVYKLLANPSTPLLQHPVAIVRLGQFLMTRTSTQALALS